MENRDLARIFQEMADVIEIQGGNPFRVRSYRRAAEVIENLPINAAKTAREDPKKLKTFSGIGDGILSRIQEIVQTGRSREHEELKKETPPALLDLLEIQSLGPKKIKLIWEQLNITTVDELETAARAQKLRALPGMGEKSETKILRSIEEYRRIHGRFRLDDGIEISDSLLAYLRSTVKLRRIAAAGSVRRRCETIGDIDILVTGDEPAVAIESFVRFPSVREIQAQGETKASVIMRRGLQADLRVLADDSFGSALQYFTGSKTHNVALRERAKRMGYKISEYGLFAIGDPEGKLAGEDEEGIYSLLGLPFIPPEMRENRGEIEKAEAGELPELIEPADIRGDLHMHTIATDGRDTIAEMAAAGLKFKYEYIAITDHSKALAMTGGLDEEKVLEQIEEIGTMNAAIEGIRILKGIEVDIHEDGRLDLSDDVLARLDVVIASVHSRLNLGREQMTRRIRRALENPHVNILAHPTGRILTRRDAYEVDLEEIMRAARENRVCLEINAYPARLDLRDVDCRMARDLGVLISINSDSHAAAMFRYMRYGVFTARRGWLSCEDVINTYPWERLEKVLKKEEYR